MMNFAFDLISDLHNDLDDFDWTGQSTSLYCVVCGDVARDRNTVLRTLRHLATCYVSVFYIDGNEEHRDYLDTLDSSYQNLIDEISKIPGVIYLQNNVVVIDGVAIVGTNGWWTYAFDPQLDFSQSMEWFQRYVGIDSASALGILTRANHDAAYLINTVKRLQRHPDIHSIVMATHTLPAPWLSSHDADLTGDLRYNCLGNQHLQMALREDSSSKIKLWCFGHYHLPIDREVANIRFVSNPRGRLGSRWCQSVYYPLRLEV